MNSIASYFDLQRDYRAGAARNVPPSSPPSGRPAVWPQYLALAAGVIVEPMLHNYIATSDFALDWSSAWQRVLFGLIIAIVIFPGVYRNAFDPERPFLVQLCAIFASGIGWQSLFQASTGA